MKSLIIFGIIGALLFWLLSKRHKKRKLSKPFPPAWRDILLQKVPFYEKLPAKLQQQFERDVQHFLATTRIVGVDVEVTDEDRLLVASGAVIPVLAFPDWEYHFLEEVVLYPDLFNRNFARSGPDRYVSGMVGTGVMRGKMILSKRSLHLGFDNQTDKKNVAVHEFVHLIDMADGAIDGIPKVLLQEAETLPWLELIRQKMHEMQNQKTGINPYGATSDEEFLPVVAEYFFERPKLLRKKHPELYKVLKSMFKVPIGHHSTSL